MKLRQEININCSELAATGSQYVLLDTSRFSGTVTYYLETVGKVASGTCTVTLRRVGTTTDDATISVTATSYTRQRTASFTPPAGSTEYFLNLSGGTTPAIKAARLIILQDTGSGPLTATESQYEIGNQETGKTNTADAALSSPKYWYYESANYDGTVTFEAEVVHKGSGTMYARTIKLQEDSDGAFGSWSDKVTIVNAVAGSTTTRTRVSFTPTNGRNYRLVSSIANNMETYDVYCGKVVVVSDAFLSGSLGLSSVGSPVALAKLSSTSVALYDGAADTLTKYDLSGSSWSISGSSLSNLSPGTITDCALAPLNSTDVAFIETAADEIRLYRFSGSTWSLIGNGLFITGSYEHSIAALSSTEIALLIAAGLTKYSFDGTNWSQVGNSLYITAANAEVCGLSGTDIAFIDSTNNELRCYRFSSPDWAQVGNGLAIGSISSNQKITALSSTLVAYMENTEKRIRFFEWDGTNWSENSTSYMTVPAIGALAGLSSTQIAEANFTTDKLKALNRSPSLSTKFRPEYLLTNTNDATTGLGDYDTLFDPAEWEGVTNAYYHEHNAPSSATNTSKLQSDPDGAPGDINNSSVTGTNRARSSALTQFLNNWGLKGTGLTISGAGNPALAPMSSTRVAFIDGGLNSLRAYDFDGSSWSLVGSGLAVDAGVLPALAALSSTRVAFVGSWDDSLEAYDFDGSNWSLVGSGLTISGITAPAMAALSSTRVVVSDAAEGTLQEYDFDGSNWTPLGSQTWITGADNAALAALSSTRVAYVDTGNDSLRAYDFNGSTWSLVGIGMGLSLTSQRALAPLSSTRVAFYDATNNTLGAYDFDGFSWSLVGSRFKISGSSNAALAALSSTRVAFIDASLESLRAYDFTYPVSSVTLDSNLTAGTIYGDRIIVVSTVNLAPKPFDVMQAVKRAAHF